LKELLLSYDESYITHIDIEGMIGVKEKKNFSKKKWKEIFFCLKDRKGAKQGILLWCRSNNVLFFKLLSTFPLAKDAIVWTNSYYVFIWFSIVHHFLC